MAGRCGIQPKSRVGCFTAQGNAVALLQQRNRHPGRRLRFHIQQQLQEGLGHQFTVVGGLADVVAKGEPQGRLLVVEPRRQNARGIKEVKVLPRRTQRRVRVTPARRALATTFCRTRRLINADLPTLGKPKVSARTGLGLSLIHI